MTWDYIAGFLDGEGSIINKNRGFAISISQANKNVLEKIKKFAHIGHVYKVAKRKQHWKNSWIYTITNYNDTFDFLCKIKNKLVVKKSKAQYAINALKIILSDKQKKMRRRNFRIKEAKKLRKNGDSYREIGKKLNTDWGYVRRLIKFS